MDEFATKATAEDKGTNLRMPAALFNFIDQAATRNGRSRNSEILERLWRTVLQEDGRLPGEHQ